MQGFLEEVAERLYARYGEALSERAVLFPSRRARLFFTEALSRIVGRPIWQPQWVTVDDLMSEISGLHTGERIRLITELYKVYSTYHDEPFDKFYFWGDLLLNDFDTIDKYRIDADMLFRNISDLKELESDLSYLTPAQLQIIRTFWSSFGREADLSKEKRRFLAIWRTLGPIYRDYRKRLESVGIAYNGMVQRAAAERLQEGSFAFPEPRHYVVAGFNALSECEKRLFRFLATNAETDFYWDYDSYYTVNSEQEAGLFVRDNIVRFPARDDLSHDNMRHEKQLTAVAAVSNAVQCKYVAEILQQLSAEAPLDKRTAIVLTDENLLMPLLYALPSEANEINVTMGYPLRSTLAYTFIERLIELQHHRRTDKNGHTAFYHTDVTGLLSHPYVMEHDSATTATQQETILRERRIAVDADWLGTTELLKRIFRPVATWPDMSDYLLDVLEDIAHTPYSGDDARERIEFLSVISAEIVKLRNSLEKCEIDITPEIYASLLRRHLQTQRIPFEGEPLRGVQVMGILETRNLDFDHVIILSMTDDNFPGNRLAQASFIPYNLRAAYSLPTPEHHEGVYAYYFYRLIQRAKSVHMLYCSHADEKSTGEPSRYIRQLDYESGFPIRKIEVGVDVNLAESNSIEVPKDANVLHSLARFTDSTDPATLSPTAFFRYVACPLRFYFASVARLKPDDEITEEIDAPMFGTILHAAVQKLYARIKDESHPSNTLKALLRTDAIARAVEAAINENYLHDETASAQDYTGNLLLTKEIVMRYLRGGVLPYDAANDRFTLSGLEETVDYGFPFPTSDGERILKFAGIADRIDRLDDGSLRVVDYKTGSPHLEFKGVESLFRGMGRQRLSNIVQTLLYAMMLYHKHRIDAVPALYYVRAIHRPDYSPLLNDKEAGVCGAPYAFYCEKFEQLVRETLTEIYDPAVPFRQCEDRDTCTYCDFNPICKRGK